MLCPDLFQAVGDAIHVHALGCFPLETEQHGPVRAVAIAGQCQGAVQVGLDAGGPGQ